MTSVRVTSESLPIAPPPLAELPLNVTRFSVALIPFVKRPPPVQPPTQVLLLTVESVSDTLSKFMMPAPCTPAVFWLTTTLVRLSVATFEPMPPVAMPPPAAAPGFPLRIVMPDIDVVPFAKTSNTRSIPPPSMIDVVAPAPVMMTASVMSRSPVAARSSPRPAIVSVKVLAGMVIVSTPLLAFDAWMAARSVQTTGAVVAQFVATGPLGLSCVLVTLKVFAAARSGAGMASRHRTTTSEDQRVRRRRVSIVGVTRVTPSRRPRRLPTGQAAA